MKGVRYFIESTSDGFRFGIQFPSGREAGFERAGGHNQLERLYAASQGIYDNLRQESTPDVDPLRPQS